MDPTNPQKIKPELHTDDSEGHFIVLLVDMENNCVSIIDPMGRELDSIEGFSSDMIRRLKLLYYSENSIACYNYLLRNLFLVLPSRYNNNFNNGKVLKKRDNGQNRCNR